MTKSEDQGLVAQNAVSSNLQTQYTDEFRTKVVEVYQSDVYPNAAECAKAYQINENTIYQWINRSRKKSGDPEINAELSRLRKELARTRMELEILKNAAIHFATQAQ